MQQCGGKNVVTPDVETIPNLLILCHKTILCWYPSDQTFCHSIIWCWYPFDQTF